MHYKNTFEFKQLKKDTEVFALWRIRSFVKLVLKIILESFMDLSGTNFLLLFVCINDDQYYSVFFTNLQGPYMKYQYDQHIQGGGDTEITVYHLHR